MNVLLKVLKKNSVFKFFASLKLAVILLLALAAILATATFYESVYDSKTAQYLVYHSPLFAMFLGLLGVNLAASALIRYPWKKAQAGFVVTHLGIIILLIGALITMTFGVDGSMSLAVGETSNKITIDKPVLYFGRDLTTIKEIPAEYRWNRPKPGETTYRYPLDQNGKLTAIIDDYYHHAQGDPIYTVSPDGMPALELRLYNKNVDQKVWLTPAEGKVQMGLAQLEFYRLPNEAAVEAFRNGTPTESRGTLQVLINDKPFVINLDRLGDAPEPIDYPGASVHLLRYLPYAVVENGKLISRSNEPVNPALEIELITPEGKQSWLLFSQMPELNTRTHSEGKPVAARLLFQKAEQTNNRSLEVGLTPDLQLLYRLDGKKASVLTNETPIATGWMDLKVEAVTFLPKARRDMVYREVFPKKGTEDKAPGPAIRLSLEGAKDPSPFWLERGDIKRLPDAEGKDVIIGYGYKTVPLGFDITLKKFDIGRDPGTQVAASYSSKITVENQEHTVAMNEPFDKNGFTVYQSSYGETPDGQAFSVFAVGHDPGIALKLLGSLMLVFGCILQFYFKPKKTRLPKSGESSEEPLLD